MIGNLLGEHIYLNLGSTTPDLREIEENELKTRKRRKQFLHAKRNNVDDSSKLLVSCIISSDFIHS